MINELLYLRVLHNYIFFIIFPNNLTGAPRQGASMILLPRPRSRPRFVQLMSTFTSITSLLELLKQTL